MSYGFFASVYDRLMQEADYEARAEQVCRLLNENGASDGILLDLACGTGTMTQIYAARGYDVIGVDISPDMLMEAQQKKIASGQDILYLCQDMRALDLYGTVNCAVCSLDGLNHLTKLSDLRAALESVSLFTEAGGIFIFDVNTPYKHREVLGNNTFIYDMDDLYCAWQNELLPDDTVRITLDLFSENPEGAYDRFTESFCERAYSDDVLTELLKDAGFRVLQRYAELSSDAPRVDTQRVVYVAKKENEIYE